MGATTTGRSNHDEQQGSYAGLLSIGYIVLLLYGSLFPLSDWHEPSAAPLYLIFHHGLHGSYSDMLTNVLVYIPLGILLVRVSRARASALTTILLVTLFGSLLSFSVEYIQAYLPGRVPSILDFLLNSAGVFGGALLATVMGHETRLGHWLATARRNYIHAGGLADVGLVALALWAVSQLTPLVPSLDIANLRHGLHPLWAVIQHPRLFDGAQAIVYGLNIFALGVLSNALIRPNRHPRLLFIAFILAVLMLKVPVVERQLSMEALAGATGGIALFMLLQRGPQNVVRWMAAAALIAAVIIDESRIGTTPGTFSFNWIPFRGQINNSLIGFADILGDVWPYVTLSYFALTSRRQRSSWWLAIFGGVGIFLLLFVLEWRQQYIPGRYPDITDVLLPLVGWLLSWLYGAARREGSRNVGAANDESVPPSTRRRTLLSLFGVISIAALAGVAAISWDRLPTEAHVDENLTPKSPLPEQLPPVSLPHFRYTHPRLPAPSTGDVAQLKRNNPIYLELQRLRADGGRGRLYPVILSAFINPGSQDLDLLFDRLMALQFRQRGHEQAEPITLAYDWLYDQWSPQQRSALRAKTIEGCRYLIHTIREQGLSPYNVYLYNSPFQALMACAISVYGDDPKAEPIMRYAADYWKNRVLPVWRQIMGKNGGWHEGGEYVRVGIGKTAYVVPAMWRKATGENIFAEEPELHGFLDWLIYRTRPDETCYRWGDAALFTREVRDRIPLALEYRDAAAYSFKQRPPFQPSAWPWGPLPDPSLYNPAAIRQLPLARYFDGIGMIVARSDWSRDATYVTFKAGDNYWSHSHLDQGAFTIYKGGALAIDSGLYAKYGSDHHMNYTYQTIAHNTITVTDPDDTVPAPPRRKGQPPRPIANDGGQRRTGSGWGVEAAPLTLAEWKRKRDIYHTATMKKVFMRDGLVVAIADITPAYTNDQSGKGTFSARTRRVEKFSRTFIYDQTDDVIIVFDHVIATKAAFIKRWLFHSIQRPRRTADGFIVDIAANARRPGHAGGTLQAHVLFPKGGYLNIIGGKGFEYFVDGVNYDDQGQVERYLKTPHGSVAEPGAWRVELSPTIERKTDNFLVVMLPAVANQIRPVQVHSFESKGKPGCIVKTSERTTRWLFDPATGSVRVTIQQSSNQKNRAYTIAADMPGARFSTSAPFSSGK